MKTIFFRFVDCHSHCDPSKKKTYFQLCHKVQYTRHKTELSFIESQQTLSLYIIFFSLFWLYLFIFEHNRKIEQYIWKVKKKKKKCCKRGEKKKTRESARGTNEKKEPTNWKWDEMKSRFQIYLRFVYVFLFLFFLAI